MSLNFFQSVDDLISHQSQVLTAIIDFLLQIVLKDLQISIAIFSNFDFAQILIEKAYILIMRTLFKEFLLLGRFQEVYY